MVIELDKYLKLAQHLVLSHIETDDYAVFLFGSRAAGKGGRGTDIDIGLLGTRPVAYKRLEDLRELLENSIIPYPVDIVDFNRVDDKFKKHALRKIKVWNRPKHIALN